MNKIAEPILRAAGLEVNSSQDDDDDAMSILEAWLELPEKRMEFDGPSVEDCVPFDDELYRSVGSALVKVWSPFGAQLSSSTFPVNIIFPGGSSIGQQHHPKGVSLYDVSTAVRVTRWLRHWMDLNVVGGGGDDTELPSTTDVTLSKLILESCEGHSGEAEAIPIVHALYNHILGLPLLHSQINSYSRSLMNSLGSPSSIFSSTQNLSRSEQYKQIQDITNHLQSEWEAHLARLQFIMIEWYQVGSSSIRRQCRNHLGTIWSHFVSSPGGGGLRVENTSASGIRLTLALLYRILLGVTNLRKSHEHLLFFHLVSLHKPTSLVLWRDQTSLLDLYHEPLVQCIAILLHKKTEWIPKVIAALLEPEIWSPSNTPKMVLLLHEIDTLIGLIPMDSEDESLSVTLGIVWVPFLTILGTCLSSDHSQLSERALKFFKNEKFKKLMIKSNLETSLTTLLPALVRTEPPWNPSVRKITYFVLKSLQDENQQIFSRVCCKLFSSSVEVLPQAKLPAAIDSTRTTETSADTTQAFREKLRRPSETAPTSPSNAPRHATTSSLPPPSSRRGAPPLTMTGVAPWAVTEGSHRVPQSRTATTTGGGSSTRTNPPLTITGVAPWAQRPPTTSHKRRALDSSIGTKLVSVAETLVEPEQNRSTNSDGLKRVLQYMEVLKPSDQQLGASPWAKEQMAESPTLLSNLKFHDLVFGHELGSGFFGSVRYARLIDKNKTRSQWAEFAVKIVSTEKIKEMGYEFSIQREIAVLRLLGHPGIARLVSSFRFRDGAYLVLEYASQGDLHTLLRQKGSLDHDSTRFVIGEVVAALTSIHDIGFVYGDLKPENILITETGHIKLTDFGACRPVTEDAVLLINTSAQKLLSNLRDGDWKTTPKQDTELDQDKGEEVNIGKDEDERIEGTTAYLPPEVVLGGIPTVAADAWALGCVLYQCLSGRPPILEMDDDMTRERIVSFHVQVVDNDDDSHELIHGAHASKIQKVSRQLVLRLLNRAPSERPSMHMVADDDFFTNDGVDVFSLHRQSAYPLDAGNVAPVVDAQWSRRQLSTIWAPQPRAYDVSMPVSENAGRTLGGHSQPVEPILEGNESSAFFSKSLSNGTLGNITESQIPS